MDKLKYLIQSQEGIPSDQQRLVLLERELEGARSLSSYNLPDGSRILLTLRLRGGGPPLAFDFADTSDPSSAREHKF